MNSAEVKRRFYTALEKLTGDTLPLRNRTFIELVNDIALSSGILYGGRPLKREVALCKKI